MIKHQPRCRRVSVFGIKMWQVACNITGIKSGAYREKIPAWHDYNVKRDLYDQGREV